jgi:putative heme transporter
VALDDARRKTLWRAAQIALALLIVAGIFLAVIPHIADYGAVWRDITALTGPQLAMVVAATVWNLVTYWLQSVAAMPGLTMRQAAVQTQTTTTVANAVPGGGAVAVGLSYAMFSSWGFTEGEVARYTLVTGIWNTYIKLGLPAIALGLLAVTGQASRALVTAAVIGIVALAVSVAILVGILWSERAAEALGRGLAKPVSFLLELVGRPAVEVWGDAAVRFREESIELLRRRWVALTVTTLVSHVSLFLVLLASLRVLGVSGSQVSWEEAFGVFAFGRLVTALPITPGGVGVVELSYIGGLVWAGGQRDTVVAAVLLFRSLTYALQIPLGAVTYPIWQATKDRWHRADEPRRPKRRAPTETGGKRAAVGAGRR